MPLRNSHAEKMILYHYSSGTFSISSRVPECKDRSFRLCLNAYSLSRLTTPVAYIGVLPADPFHDIRGMPYRYFSYSPLSEKKGWGSCGRLAAPPPIICFIAMVRIQVRASAIPIRAISFPMTPPMGLFLQATSSIWTARCSTPRQPFIHNGLNLKSAFDSRRSARIIDLSCPCPKSSTYQPGMSAVSDKPCKAKHSRGASTAQTPFLG